MKKSNRVRGGALQFVLFVGMVIAILLASFVVLTYVQLKFKKQTSVVVNVVKNADLGFSYAFNNKLKINDTTVISDLTSEGGNLKLHSSYWGGYQKVIVVSSFKKQVFKKSAFIGEIIKKKDRPALYLKDNNRPLVVVGNTRISGNNFLPKQGVRPGNIAGVSYYGDVPVYGIKKSSKAQLPKVNLEQLSAIQSVDKMSSQIGANQILELNSAKEHENSFLEPEKYSIQSGAVYLSGVSIVGNIIIISKTSITVDRTANLKDVILIAPKIIIKDNVVANFQAFAKKEIKVGKSCELRYPSALVLDVDKRTDREVFSIFIAERTIVRGQILYLERETEEKRPVFNPNIVLESKTKIEGEVYCQGNVELRGSVYGSLYANNFIAMRAGGIYQNHILDGEILSNSLSEKYVGLTFKGSKKEVMKWLY